MEKSEIYLFLNSKVKDVYCAKIDNEIINFKSYILSVMIDIERTIRGTFNCDLILKNAKFDLFSQMFPNACNMFNINTDADLINIGKLLDWIRNINAHVFLSKNDIRFFEYDFSFLNEYYKFDNDIYYAQDKAITIAGLIFIILNFIRRESIEMLTKKHYLFGIISCGKFIVDFSDQFVEKVSKVNLTIPIRQIVGIDLATAILGEYKNSDDENFSISFGSPNHPIYFVNGTISSDSVYIQKNSLTKTYYKENFTLKIIDINNFIELSNELPPLCLVDYCYSVGINVFDENAHLKILEKLDLLKKLNYPKFYIDKNLFILTLSNEIADFRKLSSLLSNNICTILIVLENYIYRYNHINRKNNYSSLNEGLEYLNLPDKLFKDIIILRNFAFHGYLLGESNYDMVKSRTLTVDFIVSTLFELKMFLQKNNNLLANKIGKLISNRIVDKYIRLAYNKIIEASEEEIKQFPNYDKSLMAKKNSFVEHLYLDINVFKPLLEGNNENLINRISFNDGNSDFYLYDKFFSKSSIKEFADRYKYKIMKIEKDSFINSYYLKR